MPRVALPDDQKRKQIAVRLGPEDRERVQALAAENGHSLGAEIERLALTQLEHVETCDGPTRDLLQAIVHEIAEIEAETGKRWHKNRETWSAVAEMLHTGPIRRREVDRPADDEASKGAWQKLLDIQFEKERIAKQLRDLRISVTPEHPVRTAVKEAGLFGDVTVPAEVAYAIRHNEAAAIAALPEGVDKATARRLFERLVELDREEQDADARCTAVDKPYEEADRRGRETYHSILKERALRLRGAGKEYVLRHLMGLYF